MNTETATKAQQSIDDAVAVMMKVQRDRIVAKAATELGITTRQADRIAQAMGR